MSDVATEQAKVLPFYIVIDVSYSMTEEGKLDAANDILIELKNALAESPTIADKVRFGVIDFSEDAQVVLPLCDLSMSDENPTFTPRSSTSYVAAFRLLRSQIERDVTQLKADNLAVHRPAVFFISDGVPTDDDPEWRQAFQELTAYDKQTKQGFAYFPNVIPFGIGADPDLLKQLVHPEKRSKAYFMRDGANAGQALRQMTEVLVASTMLSGASFGNGGPGLVLPESDDLGDDIIEGDLL